MLSAMRLDFLETLEAEKNAVLATTDKASIDFADRALGAAAKVENNRKKMVSLAAQANSAEDNQALGDFNSSWAEFQTREHEILELATQNTNIKAHKLSSGQCAREAREIEAKLTDVINRSAEANRTDTVRLGYEALTAILNILALHQPHIESAQDAEMDQIEKEIDAYDKTARRALAALRLAPDPADLTSIQAAEEAYGRFMKETAEVLRLSRLNTNIKSTELSWGKQNLLAAQCESLLAALQESVRNRQWKATK